MERQMRLSEYINKSRSYRILHIDLSTPCKVIATKGGNDKAKRRRAALCELLGLVDDTTNCHKQGILCAHLCCQDGTGLCFEPKHMYFATHSENCADAEEKLAARRQGNSIGGRKAGKYMAGSKWYTNGESNLRLAKGTLPPDGYWSGQTRRK